MTIPRIIGRLICAIRARFGARPAHAYRRTVVKGSVVVTGPGAALEAVTGDVPARVCTRCGHTVPVKPRKRKGAE